MSEFNRRSFTRTTLSGTVVQKAAADNGLWRVAYPPADLGRLIALGEQPRILAQTLRVALAIPEDEGEQIVRDLIEKRRR